MKLFIDGAEGTTGLEIVSRLHEVPGAEQIPLPSALRKDPDARRAAMEQADITVLCLPDAAAKEAVALAEGTRTRLLDASTAHRTAPGWVYGLPELCPGQREAIASAGRVANPGCHATGFILLARPLAEAGWISPELPVTAFSTTGYSGGGKRMIAAYEAGGRPEELAYPRIYGLAQQHKHLPEMAVYGTLGQPPVFNPVVCDYYRGMSVTLFMTAGDPDTAMAIYRERYAAGRVRVVDPPEDGYFSCQPVCHTDGGLLTASGRPGRWSATLALDNLGLGACGAALENLRIMCGIR